MKLVGVMGKSGAGKTTFTDILAENSNVGIIHVDDLVAKAKQKYFKMFLQPSQKNTTENTKKNPKLDSRAKEFFYANKTMFNILMKIRSSLVRKPLDEEIRKLKIQGKRVIVIDDWALNTHKNLYSKLNRIYYIERNFLCRRRSLKLRDDLNNAELRISDIPYAMGHLKKPTGAKVTTISNAGTIEDLRTKAREEYEKLGEQTFDDKYIIGVDFSSVLKKEINKEIQKTKEVRKRERIREDKF